MGKGDNVRPLSNTVAEYTKLWDDTFRKEPNPVIEMKKPRCQRCRDTGVQWKPLPNPNEAWVSTSCPDCLPSVESD